MIWSSLTKSKIFIVVLLSMNRDEKMKRKIAISMDMALLQMIDATIDNVSITSRSQAISVLLQKALEKQYVTQAVILLKSEHIPLLFHEVDGKTFLEQQIQFLLANSIEKIFLITKDHYQLETIKRTFQKYPVSFHLILEKQQQGSVPALSLLQNELRTNFVLLNGDTLNLFPLKKMILFHLKTDKVITIGLTTSSDPKAYNTVELEGDQIVAYRKNANSHIIDAGIYICKPTLFSFFTKHTKILERDIFPKLCSLQQAQGYFTYGSYTHFGV